MRLQETHRQFLLLADTQALTDNAHDPERGRRGVLEVPLDYLAVPPFQPSLYAQRLNNHAAILRSKNVMGTGVIPAEREDRDRFWSRCGLSKPPASA